MVKNISTGFTNIFGYSNETLLDTLFSTILIKGSRIKINNACEYVKTNTSREWTVVLDLEAPNGKRMYSKIIISPIFDKDHLQGFIFILEDLTSQKLADALETKILFYEKRDKTTLNVRQT